MYYSRTGTTRFLAGQAAGILRRAGHTVTEVEIRPTLDLPYFLWLALSFIPGARFPIQTNLPDPADFDGCLLASPKWTFACPPFNAYLSSWGRRLPRTALLVSCGGWDQERYLRVLGARLVDAGVTVCSSCWVRRRDVSRESLGPAVGTLVEALTGFDA